MSLLGPNEHDKEKLHSEVNQIVNQRLLITTLAVTVLGAGIAKNLVGSDTVLEVKYFLMQN